MSLQKALSLQTESGDSRKDKMALTDTQIRALKPKASRYLTSDGRGLSLDVLPSAVTTWTHRYRQKMLQWWADYVDSIVNESKVIVGNFGGSTA